MGGGLKAGGEEVGGELGGGAIEVVRIEKLQTASYSTIVIIQQLNRGCWSLLSAFFFIGCIDSGLLAL